MENLKKYGFSGKTNNNNNSIELLFNLKKLYFIEPNNIFSLYKKKNIPINIIKNFMIILKKIIFLIGTIII